MAEDTASEATAELRAKALVVKIKKASIPSADRKSAEALQQDLKALLRIQPDKRDDKIARKIRKGLDRLGLLWTIPKYHESIALALCKIVTWVEVWKKDTSIFSQGDFGDCFYIIANGRVKAWLRDDLGRMCVLQVFRKGEVVGHAAVESQSTRSAHVSTDVEDTELLRVDAEEYRRIVAPQMEQDLKDKFQLLRGLPVFKTWSDERVSVMAHRSSRRYYRAMDMLVQQGDVSNEVYLLVQGQCAVLRTVGVPRSAMKPQPLAVRILDDNTEAIVLREDYIPPDKPPKTPFLTQASTEKNALLLSAHGPRPPKLPPLPPMPAIGGGTVGGQQNSHRQRNRHFSMGSVSERGGRENSNNSSSRRESLDPFPSPRRSTRGSRSARESLVEGSEDHPSPHHVPFRSPTTTGPLDALVEHETTTTATTGGAPWSNVAAIQAARRQTRSDSLASSNISPRSPSKSPKSPAATTAAGNLQSPTSFAAVARSPRRSRATPPSPRRAKLMGSLRRQDSVYELQMNLGRVPSLEEVRRQGLRSDFVDSTVEVTHLWRGALIGDFGVLARTYRWSSVIALTRIEVLVISKGHLLQEMESEAKELQTGKKRHQLAVQNTNLRKMMDSLQAEVNWDHYKQFAVKQVIDARTARKQRALHLADARHVAVRPPYR